MKRKGVVKLLKELNQGQGFSFVSCHYDSQGSATFGIHVTRERDGLIFGPKENLTEDEFYDLLEKLVSS